ncbi:hypothetical protein EB796_006043 [Bugula neritina]|uniref:Uncharacterized protein n=1 Tax=Bugula neritina TaxID=10212 RepID=A0A7J7KDF0_BUGNE|nr:hypothetical protein EB796_006043 [Bugula neritina]
MKPPHLLSKSDSVLKYLAPVFTLTVLHRISYTKELVPYLYGTPMVLEATQCWKIDWDELEVNKSHVSALHSTLQQQNLASYASCSSAVLMMTQCHSLLLYIPNYTLSAHPSRVLQRAAALSDLFSCQTGSCVNYQGR